MSETHTSICRFCHASCPILVDVEDGRVVRIVGEFKSTGEVLTKDTVVGGFSNPLNGDRHPRGRD